MISRINGQLMFFYGCPAIKTNKFKPLGQITTSLLVILIGIFLLPKIAWLSEITPEKLIELTNQERLAAGLNSLTANQLLAKAAWDKAQEILKSQTFKHNINGKRFSDWVRSAGYNYSYVGENLAIDFVSSEGVVDAWNNSPLHKKNLLNPYYEEIGIAAANGNFDGQETTVVVQIFGAPPHSAVQSAAVSQPTFSQPEINYLHNDYTFARPLAAENLLTDVVTNQILLPTITNPASLNNINNMNNKLNNFFERLNAAVWPLSDFFSIFMSLAMVALLVYFYYFYFFKTVRLLHL